MKPITQRLDRFDLIAELAGADGAKLWLGASGRGGRVVAIKRLHPDLTSNEARARRFRAEAEAAAKLRCPTVVAVLDTGASADGHYLVLEHVEGEHLGRLVARSVPRGGVPLRVAIRIGLDALSGLSAVHNHPGPDGRAPEMLRRGVSTTSLLVGIDGVTRIADVTVGIARGGATATSIAAAAGARAEAVAEDLYAMAVALWETIAGRRLVRGDGGVEPDPFGAGLHVPAPRLDTLRPEVPIALAEVIALALHRDPARRPARADQLAAALDAAAAPAGLIGTHAEVAAHVDAAVGAELVRQRDSVRSLLEKLEPTIGFPTGSDFLASVGGAAPPRGEVTASYAGARSRSSAARRAAAPTEDLTPAAAAAAAAATAPAARANASAPQKFGKYAVMRHLADGGMAEVYLARATGIEGFEKVVVIKRLKGDLASNPTATELFLQEARIAATLEHPQIAQVYDVGVDGGSYFFAMEYVQGEDLRKVMSTAIRGRREIPLEDALRIVTELCGALHYAHEKHGPDGEHLALVHRDVSPSNVLISYDGAIKLCDFGVAEVAAARRDPKKRIVAGKLSYMSPEQCRGEVLDRRSDIFVLAVVLYELTTLTKLFKGKNDHEVARQIVEGRVRPPSTIRLGYPPELERIVMKGLALLPNDRYKTAQEMRIDLEAFGRENKLALSAVRISELMASLFPPSDRGDSPAPHSASEFGFAPVVSVHAPRAWYAWWLVAALLAAGAGGATIMLDRQRTDPRIEVEAQLANAGERVGAALTTQLRAARSRADAIAVTPMLRAAIGTDAGTLQDMAGRDAIVTPGPGEAIECFRWRGGRSASLLRVPAAGPALEPMRGTTTRLVLGAGPDAGLVVMASAPVVPLYRDKDLEGSIVVTSALDPAALAGALPPGLTGVQLRGLTRDLALGPAATFPPASAIAAPVPLEAAWQLPPFSLEAPVPAAVPSKLPPVRYAAFGAAGLFGLLFLVGRRRHRWWRVR